MSQTPTKANEHVLCEFSCKKCRARGTFSPVRHDGESAADTATRAAANTRGMCLNGCQFQALPAPPVDATGVK